MSAFRGLVFCALSLGVENSTKTVIKSRTSSIASQFGPLVLELLALERRKFSHGLIRKMLGLFSFFYHIVMKVARNQDNHNSSNKFEFRIHPSIDFRVSYP